MFKIFCEDNKGTTIFQNQMNDFFADKGDVIIHSMNTVLEIDGGIGYMNTIVCWEYK